jgi:peptidoglycan/xylan/chitin deacetylase (PgdA/CDA1 family)
MTSSLAPLLITFDDGYTSTYDAYQYMAARGVKGTNYMITNKIGTAGYLSAANLQTMAASGLWTVANHTRTHTVLTTLTQGQQETELTNGDADLQALGITTGKHVGYPGGQYDATTLAAMAATSMLTGRNSNAGAFFPPIADKYQINNSYIGNTTTLIAAKALINAAQVNGQILVISFHDLVASSPGTYDWTVGDFQALVDYIAAQGYMTMTMAEFYAAIIE